jgi:hypothetical protein
LVGQRLSVDLSAPGGATGDPLAAAALIYLMLLPVGHLILVPVGGPMATGADLALGGLLAAGVVAEGGARLGGAPRPAGVARPLPGFGRAAALLAAFGVWAGLSGAWGYHPRYAAFKGLGYVCLAAGAWLIARSGAGWRRLAAAWLIGSASALAVLLIGALGPEALSGRVLYGAGAVRGLPVPRASGPFLHPSMLGCHLAVSGALLWGLWPELGARARRVARVGAAVGLFTLALTVSTGWVAAGVAAILIGRDDAFAARPRLGVAVRIGGALLASVALVGVLVPVRLDVADWAVRTGAIRPALWTSALAAVVTAPLMGVGAAPFLATAPDPMGGPELYVWDAHQAYLSVLGQFGVVGGALLGAGVLLIVRALLAARPSRARIATLAALAGVAAHGFLVANEDFRHVWALLGLAGAIGAEPTHAGSTPASR